MGDCESLRVLLLSFKGLKESGEEWDRNVNFGLGEGEFGIVKEGIRVEEIDDIAIANFYLFFC